MKWCLCAKRWKEGFDAAQKGLISYDSVPKVHLHASHESALDVVSYKQLKQYSAEPEAANNGGRQTSHAKPEVSGGIAKESKEIGGDMGTTAPSKESRKSAK